jgi:Sulfotransferase domain
MNTSSKTFLSLANEPFTLEIPLSVGNGSYFVLAPHKSGSVLLFSFVQDLARIANRSIVDFPDQAFLQGVDVRDFPLDALALFEDPGHIFIGNRDPHLFSSVRAYRSSRKVILVRDPRDIAVSYYFSVRASHPIPASGSIADDLKERREASLRLDIESFLRERWIDVIFENMREFWRHICRFPDFRIFRYEDVIFEKERFVTNLAAELQMSLAQADLIDIANRHDIRPSEDRPNEHIRHVTPGNYKDHLSTTACRRLELIFEDVFEAFGYPLSF